LTLSNTSSFLTWSFQRIFSFLLQHHISKLWSVSNKKFSVFKLGLT
jgi:hypothetical protein